MGVAQGAIAGDISIHALLTESDLYYFDFSGLWYGFLSTLSLRRATAKPWRKYHTADISIHALLTESDVCVIELIE